MSAKDILQSIIDLLNNEAGKFDVKMFINFFRAKNDKLRSPNDPLGYEDAENNTDTTSKQFFTEGRKLAEGKLDDGELIVCSFLVEKELTERSGKKAQYILGKKILKEQQADAGIFIFYSPQGNFRFSLIYTDYLGKRRDWNNFKRFTYFVSKEFTNKTFIKQIGEGDFSSLQKIKEAFSVEPVTKQFYNEIQSWYFWAMDKVEFPDDYKYNTDSDRAKEIRNATNLIRLITRVIFIWFLMEKDLVSLDLFLKEKLKKIVRDFMKDEKASNFYNAVLQNLFFGTLNQKIAERKFVDERGYPANIKEYGVKNLYRYADKFLITKDEVLKLFRDIPFLNGGLFDCLDKEDETGKVIYIDGFSRNPKKQSIIPDYLFFQENEEMVDLSEYGLGKKPVRRLIEILNSYNFTIDENTPIDQEVALDPELLGKVFENLLASYNPETATTARKATGSYYTPRETVDYMVEISLFEYLKGKLSETEEENIKMLLSYSEKIPEFSNEEKQKVISAIDEIKILDPACGSGAFPMGVLHKLVFILEKLDPENKHWHELQYQKALKESEEVFKESNKNQREERLKEINETFDETFDESINYPDYARKLYLIENCIYGVDIQPIAIQISKLRFFISLVLDQKVDRKKENFGIRALPNLETRFVAANTLIGLDIPQHLFYTDKIQKLEDDIKSLRHKYFQTKTRSEKLNYQKQDATLRELLAKELKEIGFSSESSEKIVKFDLYNQNASADFFDPEWMFGIEDGFDIIIGNPPYISTKGSNENDKKTLKNLYGFADDFYSHFIFKGIEILKDNGILAFITSKTYWTIQTKKNLRELLLKNKILEIYDTGNPFDAPMVDTAIIIVQKKNEDNNYNFYFKDGKKDFLNPIIYEENINLYKKAPNKIFFIPNETNKTIANKYFSKVQPLLDIWWDKISTSKNIENYKNELEKYRNSLKPGDVTLLGLITEGGQGLATANNGKYIGVLEGTKWAENVKKQRPEKLLLAVEFCSQNNIKNKDDADAFINKLNELEIRKLFDKIKEKYGRDIFGQGWLYRIVSDDEIADVDLLTDDEKLNGIEGDKTFVPYDKGDKDGNRWYAPTPYYIAWNKDNVKFLKENSGKKGEGMPVVRNPQFYFREGFCWNNVTGVNIKCRIKAKSLHSTEAMSLFTLNDKFLPNFYFICLLNSNFLGNYKNNFLNISPHLTTGDAKEFPIMIPNAEQLHVFENIFNRAVAIQKDKFSGKIAEDEAEKQLNLIQIELDKEVEELYDV